MEVDGKTVVLVVQDGGGAIFVMFYMWTSNEGWQLDRRFDLSNMSVEGGAAAAISDKAAFVGFPYADKEIGTVVVFHQDQAGIWEKVNAPFILKGIAPALWFGYDVGIDGNLAIVAAQINWSGNPNILWNGKILVFRRESNQWVQFNMFAGVCPCSIAGDVIVSLKLDGDKQVVQLYKYTADTGAFVPIQDPIPSENVIQIDSSNDYFLYWDAAAS